MHVAVFHGSVPTEFFTSHHQSDLDDKGDHDHQENGHEDSDVCVASLVHAHVFEAQVLLSAYWHLSEHLNPVADQAGIQIAAPVFSGRAPPLYS